MFEAFPSSWPYIFWNIFSQKRPTRTRPAPQRPAPPGKHPGSSSLELLPTKRFSLSILVLEFNCPRRGHVTLHSCCWPQVATHRLHVFCQHDMTASSSLPHCWRQMLLSYFLVQIFRRSNCSNLHSFCMLGGGLLVPFFYPKSATSFFQVFDLTCSSLQWGIEQKVSPHSVSSMFS